MKTEVKPLIRPRNKDRLEENLPPANERDARIKELADEKKRLDEEIAELEKKIQAAELGLDVKTGEISVDNLVEANIRPEEAVLIKNEFPQKNLVETIKEGVVRDLNDKTPRTAKEEAAQSAYKKVTGRIKRILLNLFIVASSFITTSFSYSTSAEALTYGDIKVDNLKDWEKIKLGQDEVNKLENISIITEANKNSGEKYIVIDKLAALAHLYEGHNLISTYEIGVGQNKGDAQTLTVIKNGKVFWDLGNKQTGAGIFTINKKSTFMGAPSFTLLNERGIEVPTVLHRTLPERNKFFNNNNVQDNRMSNGCINFHARSWNSLAGKNVLNKNTRVYVLPDDPHNKYQIVDGELRFLSNETDVNRTIRPYEPKPIILIAEDVNIHGRKFLDTISGSKAKLMPMYPTVSNEVYNRLAKIAYGVFGQESSFGTYGGGRGQVGMVADYIGNALDKNVSAGITQIRITSINPRIRTTFGIRTTEDLFDDKKAAIATMSLLLDIYVNNIPNDKKGDYETLVPFYYNNPFGSREAIKSKNKGGSVYVKKVRDYSNKVKVYSGIF